MGKKVIPVVINGQSISPPRMTLAQASPIELIDNAQASGACYLFVLDNFPIESKTKLEFLLKDMENHLEDMFIFVVNEDQNISSRMEQRKRLSSDEFKICDVSFAEIATFLETSFDMPSKEAEVVAFALRSAFQKFSLPAHPSFFAGIPSAALSALLVANRRSELVQIAVDGTLSYLVASDSSPIRLSRTTRAAFLRKLVVQQKVFKKSFSESGIVEFARGISDEFDYGIDPIGFISGFVDKGILYFDNDVAHITLPFIESYLLAIELVANPSTAKDYFSVIFGEEFDHLTFDLYCELGPSPEIISRTCANLGDAIARIAVPEERNVLLTGELMRWPLK